MKTQQIKELIKQGHSMDSIYRIAAGNLGLFGVAFFGHKGKRGDKAKLNRVWHRIVNVFNEIIENMVNTMLHPMFENEPLVNRKERLEFIMYLVMKYDWLLTKTILDKELLDFSNNPNAN